MSTLPTTKPSSTMTLQQMGLFGRKYRIDVTLPSSDGAGQTVLTLTSSEFEPEALRATFDIFTPAFQAFWYADISIYNLDQTTTEQILGTSQNPIKQGMQVTIAAGYQNGNYGAIWSGPVFQPLWERENVTDFKITLHCILGLDILSRNSISSTFAAKTNQTQLIERIAAQAFSPIQLGTVSANLSAKQLPRGVAVFGNPNKYFTQIAEDNNMQWWLGPEGLNVGRPDEDTTSQPAIVYTPENGLIGTPQQTQYGVAFRVLMDPRLKVSKPLQQVKIDNSSIRLLKKQIGQLPSVLDQDGIYIIGALRFLGDTRGQEWYTEVIGYTSVGGKLAMMQAVAAANLNGG